MFLSSELNQANVVPDPTVYAQEALSMSSMDDQSLFDSYENQKVPTGRPHKFVGGDAWSKKRPVDADFDDFHAPPKRANLYDGVKCEVQECVDDKRVIVPADPMCWTNDHVHQWVNWAVKEFSLKDVNVEAFTMCGRDLCRFTREDFMRLAPAYNGDILLAHLCVLRKAPLPDLTTDDIDKALAPPLSHQTSSCAKSIGQPRVTESERHACSSSVGGHSRTVPVARADGSEYMTNCVFQPPSNSSSGSDYQSRDSVVPNKAFCEGSPAPSDFPNGSVGAKTPSSLHAPPSHGGSGQIQLWQFLLELLSDPGNSSCIAWEGSNGEFKLTDPDEVARRWGERKNKPNMNYDKLSRALRYYYDKNIMTKIHGKRYAYKFDFQGLAQLNQPITSDAQLHAAQAAAYRGEYPFYTSYGPASSPYPYPPSGGVGSGYPACYSSLSPQNQYGAPAPYSAWGRPSYVPSMYRQNSLPYY